MNAGASTSPVGAALPIWRGPAAWMRTADIVAVLIALALPWSTSLVAIFVVAWIIVVAPTLDRKDFARSLQQPACMLPIAFFALSVIGTLWSDAPWSARLYAISPAAKLLVLPLLVSSLFNSHLFDFHEGWTYVLGGE
jgi:hypothetical protein